MLLVKNEAEIQMSRARSVSQNSKIKLKKNQSRNELMPRTNSQPHQQLSQRRGARPTQGSSAKQIPTQSSSREHL
jgi:hypothetical protein